MFLHYMLPHRPWVRPSPEQRSSFLPLAALSGKQVVVWIFLSLLLLLSSEWLFLFRRLLWGAAFPLP
jgi:hypothetical protein